MTGRGLRALPSLRSLVERFPALKALDSSRLIRTIPFVPQMGPTECGAACLAMVLRYHGRFVPVDALRELTVSGRDGTNAQVLITAARPYGLLGRAISLELDQLHLLPRGTILHWNFGHFVVLDKLTRKGARILDPQRGAWYPSREVLDRSFTGVAIIFERAPDFVAVRDSGRGRLREYLRQVTGERSFVTHILIASVVLQALGIAPALINRSVIDRVIPQRDYDLLSALALGFLAVGVFQAWTAMLRSQILLFLRARLDARMTLTFLEHLLDLPFEFFQRRSSGDLLVRLNSNTAIREILTNTVLSTALDGVLAFGYLTVILLVNVPLAVGAIVVAAVQAVVLVLTRRKQRQLLQQGLEAQGRSQGYLMEVLGGIETIKSMGIGSKATEQWSTLFTNELNVSLRRGRLEAGLGAISTLVHSGSTLLLLVVGSRQVMAGAISLGDMIALTTLANGFIGPLLALANTGSRLQLLSIYVERADDVLQTPRERDGEGLRPAPRLSGTIRVQDVTFRYGPTAPHVVQGVSVDIASGEFVAIVGRSGSGKSTLARLLVGLFRPESGAVYYDGVDLAALSPETVRKQIGIVTQQPHLFAGSIRSNIAIGDPDLDLDAVIQAARMAGVHEDIAALPLAYDTVLGSQGTALSGGQRQRLCLARALAGNPRVLILDEATSSLDASTERIVRETLERLDCTRVVIAHRLSTIRMADRVLVLENGRLVEEGTHDALVARAGVYADLVRSQT